MQVIAAVAISGCHNFDNVDEACKDSVRGDGDASFEATEVYRRVSCYRRFTGMSQANMNARITEAVEAHAQYLELNGLDEYWQFEDGGSGYTGTTAFDRLDRSEYRAMEEGSAFVWEVLLPVFPDTPRSTLIDELMHDPFARDVFLAPAWEGGGYAEFVDEVFGDYSYWNIVLYHPSGARSARPVAYPADGQLDLPNTWAVPPYPDTVLQGLPSISGYPITFTVGSNEVGAGSNPLNLEVRSSLITGPSGPVEHVIVGPGNYSWGTTWSTAALIPVAPLQAGTTYTAEVELSWISRVKKVETVTFTTATSSAPLARQAPVRTRLTPLFSL